MMSVIYGQVIALRRALSLPFAHIVPFDVWVDLNSEQFQADWPDLVFNTHDAIVNYLKPMYDDAMSHAKEKLRKELDRRPASCVEQYQSMWAGQDCLFILPTDKQELVRNRQQLLQYFPQHFKPAAGK